MVDYIEVNPATTDRMQIGRYTNLSLLGQGGMGAVYRAHDPSLDRTVALKVVLNQSSGSDQFLARFEREAKAVARLSHPHIVQVYDFGQDDNGNPYFVMELIKGRSLDALLKEKGALPPAQAVDVLRQAALGLQAAHAAGIVHRDVKPQNMLLDDNQQVKLVDFGIARVQGVNEGLTSNNEALGTLHYMAPEVLSGQQADARADIYSLGLVIFHLLVGKPPFTADSAVGVAMKQISEPLPDLEKAAPQTPASLRKLIERMTQKDRDKRVQTCEEIVRQATVIAEELLTTMPMPTGKLPTSNSRVIVLAGGLGLLSAAVLALLIGGFSAKRRRAQLPPVQPVAVQPVALAPEAGGIKRTENNLATATKPHVQPTGPVRVTILRFRNLGTVAEHLDPGQGIAETITTAFSDLQDKIVLVERNQFDEHNLAELKLNQEGFMDKEKAAQYGRVIGTEVLVQGAFQRIDKTLRITSRFTRVETGEILDTTSLTMAFDKPADIFAIHDKVAEELRKHLLQLLPRIRS